MLKIGTILYKEHMGKTRPFVCISKYTNNAGVVYNYLIAPITSSSKLGDENLVAINHDLLKGSFIKINNIQTIQEVDLDSVKISKFQLDKTEIRYAIVKIIKILKKWEKM